MRAVTPVVKIMSKKPETVTPEDNMESVRKIFEKKGFHHVPVVQQGKLVGIVSYTDYLRLIRNLFDNPHEERANEKVLGATLVRDVMTKHVLCLGPNDSLESAVRVFKTNQFHALPVVDENRRLMGIVTTYDLMKVLEKLFVEQMETT